MAGISFIHQFLHCRKLNLRTISSICSSSPRNWQKVQNFAPALTCRSLYTVAELSKTETIYSGPLSKKLWFLKIVTLISSVGYLPLQFKFWESYAASNSIMYAVCSGLLACFQIFTPLIIHAIGTKYVIRMHYDAEKDRYIAVTYSFLVREKYLTFTPKDVSLPTVEILSTVKIKNKNLFFDPTQFRNLEHYKKILGYDKPIELGLESEQENRKTEEKKT